MIENQQLVQLCLDGNDPAWAQLVEEHRALVYGICRLFPSADRDAEDLMQEAFIKIWMSLGSYSPARGSLKAWVAAIARNVGIDRYRGNGNQRKTISVDAISEASEMIVFGQFVDSRPTPHDLASLDEMTGIVLQEAKNIPAEMWKVVSMRFLYDLDESEIANSLRIPKGTVKSRINRGRARLAVRLRRLQIAFATV